MTVGQDLLNVPFAQMVRNLGVGIAEAQLELDLVSMKIARMMAGYAVTEGDEEKDLIEEDDAGRQYLVKFVDGKEYSLLELGFTPNFYQFADTVIELKMSITMQTETTTSQKRKQVTAAGGGVAFPFFAAGAVSVTSVSASYASKYQYSAEGSSMMRTKLVPVPAPVILEERIRNFLNTPANGDDEG